MQKDISALLIDDDEDFLKLFTSMLNTLGVNSSSHVNPEIGLEEAAKLKPSIIFLDFEMPEMTGAEFMKKFSEKLLFGTSIIVCVTSVEVTETFEMNMLTLGVENILSKPVNIKQIEDLLNAKFPK